ncbi:hypothetical protein K504DRAFT_502470 [Pleomassaria siparia CBS 279.74]|uniref:Uncharacterized protein n=1 Tax=Pleomassaria siparia CBS 279.74 TaxID=1314801 RepID=A0A6G1KB39_9PLEO|nr:hypothetical protein K504DRAFT_502470 [Pleomassaria siparia CBS 279.74]
MIPFLNLQYKDPDGHISFSSRFDLQGFDIPPISEPPGCETVSKFQQVTTDGSPVLPPTTIYWLYHIYSVLYSGEIFGFATHMTPGLPGRLTASESTVPEVGQLQYHDFAVRPDSFIVPSRWHAINAGNTKEDNFLEYFTKRGLQIDQNYINAQHMQSMAALALT